MLGTKNGDFSNSSNDLYQPDHFLSLGISKSLTWQLVSLFTHTLDFKEQGHHHITFLQQSPIKKKPLKVSENLNLIYAI